MVPSQEPYRDSPSPSRSSTLALSSATPAPKTRPSLPLGTPTQPLEPYRDEPSPTSSAPVPAPTTTSPAPWHHDTPTSASNGRLQHADIQLFFTPYTDAPRAANDEDVPLAHLYPYPTEAPPPYQVAVRESYRETLIQHIANRSVSTVDEEVGIDRTQVDDVRFTVEKIVAAIIVAMLLLVIASLFALVAISGFNWKI